MRRPVGIVVVGIALAIGCGGASSTTRTTTTTTTHRVSTEPHDPCDGAELSLGEAAESCRVDEPCADPPAAERVAIEVVTRSIASGVDGVVELAFRNLTDDAIVLDFPGTLRFDASMWSGEQRVDERWEISGIAGGAVGCRAGADCRTVRVRLAPRGTLIAAVPFATRIEILRDGASAGQIVRTDGGPIAPGDYTFRVVIPWTDPVAGSATGARTPRIVQGPIAVTR